jgi:hypothetical protein
MRFSSDCLKLYGRYMTHAVTDRMIIAMNIETDDISFKKPGTRMRSGTHYRYSMFLG